MEPKDYSQIINNLDIPVLITVAAWTFQLEKFKELKGDITIENFKIHAMFIDESERFNKLLIELKDKAFAKDK
jgi:hypothetical protein